MRKAIICKISHYFIIVVICFCQGCNKQNSKDILSRYEKEWLASQEGRINVAITRIPPQVIITEDGSFQGLSIDYIHLIEKKIGFRFNLVYYDTWDKLIEDVKKGGSQIIFAAQYTPERAKFLRFTAPYIFLPNMIIVNQKYTGSLNLKDLSGVKTAVVKGSAVDEFLSSKHGDITLIRSADELDALNKTSFGETEAAVLETSRASYYIRERGITNLRIAGSAEYEYQLRLASRSDLPVLNQVLDKGLMSISNEERETIINRWIPLVETVSIERYRIWLYIIGIITFIVTVLVVFIFLWNRILQDKVKERTEELETYKNHLVELVDVRTLELQKSNDELKDAILKIKTLSGLLPICSSCKKIRDDMGYWSQIEVYIKNHSDADFSHGLCPDCAKKLYPGMFK